VRRDRGELEDRGEDIRAGFVGEDDVVLDRGVIEQREERVARASSLLVVSHRKIQEAVVAASA